MAHWLDLDKKWLRVPEFVRSHLRAHDYAGPHDALSKCDDPICLWWLANTALKDKASLSLAIGTAFAELDQVDNQKGFHHEGASFVRGIFASLKDTHSSEQARADGVNDAMKLVVTELRRLAKDAFE